MQFIPKTAEGFGTVAAVQPQENLQFYLHLSLETVFRAPKLIQYKLLHNEYWLLYPPHIPCLNDNPHNLTKYESKGTSNIPISQLFSELRNIKSSGVT